VAVALPGCAWEHNVQAASISLVCDSRGMHDANSINVGIDMLGFTPQLAKRSRCPHMTVLGQAL
jgi:hypothetical protein